MGEKETEHAVLTCSERGFSQAAVNTLSILLDLLQIFCQWTDDLH